MNDRDIEDTRMPPDEIEARECEFCSQEMEVESDWLEQKYYVCRNFYCPENYTGAARQVAEKLVDTLDTVSRLEKRVKFLARKLQIYEMIEKGV
jgi:hypothetical protein